MAHRTVLCQEAVVASLDALTALLDKSDNPARLAIYAGTQPPSPEEPANGILLADVELEPVAFKPAEIVDSGAVARCAGLPKKVHARASGTAAYFRAYDGELRPIIDGSVGVAGSDMVLDTVKIVQNQAIEIAEWTLAMANC